MTASNDTVAQVLRVLEKYLTPGQIKRVLDDLSKVTGNASFTDTIARLRKRAAMERWWATL